MSIVRRRDRMPPLPKLWPIIGYEITEAERLAYLFGVYDTRRPPWLDRPRPEPQEGRNRGESLGLVHKSGARRPAKSTKEKPE